MTIVDRLETRAGDLPPGPPAPALLGPLPGLLTGAAYLVGGERVLDRALRRYGSAMSLRLPGLGTVVMINDPGLVRHVFRESPDVLLGGEGVGPSAEIYGEQSMFVLDEPEHLRRRRLLTPPLHGKALATYAPLIARRTSGAVDQIPASVPFSLLHWARALTLEVITEVMFGESDAEELQRLGRPFEQLLDLGLSEEVAIRHVLRKSARVGRWARRDAAWAAITDVVLPLIAARRDEQTTSERTDILSLLVKARAEDGSALTDQEIRDDLITLMLAGHETTATTLTWAVELLLRHPEAMQRVTRDIRSGGSDAYLEAVIHETLRLRPPVPFTGRTTATRYELGPWSLPPGTLIVPHIRSLNRDAGLHEDALSFAPERYLGKQPDSHAWAPFGGGVKRCLGASFSMLELTTMLRVLLERGDLSAVRKRPEPERRKGVVILPGHGVPVRYHPRPGAG